MNRKKVILIIVIVVLIIIIVISMFILNDNNRPTTFSKEKLEQFQQDQENLDTIVANQDINNCNSLKSRYKAICIKKIAVNKTEEALCSKIGEDNGETWGMDQECYLEIAIKKNRIDICNKLINGAKKNSCISAIALNLNKLEMCSLINQSISSGKADRYLCYSGLARINKDILICANIDILVDKDWCIIEVAVVSNDILICDKIKDSFTNSRCLSKF